MPLKGVLLVALGVRQAADRPMIDVDVLVDPSRARAVVSAARAHGWDVPAGNDWSCALVHPAIRSMSIDLHRTLFPRHFFAMDTEGVFRRGRADDKLFGRDVVIMSAVDLYAHLVGHFVKGRADRRDALHLRDFSAVGRWSGVTPDVCAAHLVRVGLARAARYALPLADQLERDEYARAVLAALPRDRRGAVLAHFADAMLSRVPPRSQAGIPFVHALNRNLWSGTRSLVAHIREPGGAPRARDGWWQS